MLTSARAAISRVDAPWNPFAANTSSAAARMRPLVEPGASRAFSSADLTTRTKRLKRSTERSRTAGRQRLSTMSEAGSVDDLLAHREADDLRRVVEIELLHDVLAVRLDRVDAHREHGRDFLVRLPLGNQLENLALAVGQERQV